MSFKKCTSLFLAFLLLVSNIGLAFNVHYCGGHIASVTSVHSTGPVCEMVKVPVKSSCCAKKIAAEHKKCCSDKVVNLQDGNDDVIVKNFSFQIDAPFVMDYWKPVVFSPISVLVPAQTTATYYCEAHAPPLFKLYSQYIFYA